MHNCKLISDITILSGNKTLLVKYKDGNKYDHQTGWFIPDDQLLNLEDPDDSAKRILKEQLSITNCEVKISFIESFQGNDRSWHIIFHYRTDLNSAAEIKPSVEIETYEWFDLNELPDKKDVAHHGWALYTLKEITGN